MKAWILEGSFYFNVNELNSMRHCFLNLESLAFLVKTMTCRVPPHPPHGQYIYYFKFFGLYEVDFNILQSVTPLSLI